MEARDPGGDITDCPLLVCLGLIFSSDARKSMNNNNIIFNRHGHVCYTIENGTVKIAAGEDLVVAFCVGFAYQLFQ